MKNTLKYGSVRTIIFRENDTWYAVGLEFNLVTEGDTPEIASFKLGEAISGYVESLANSDIGGLRTEGILNQTADSEYEELWNKLENNEPVPSPYKDKVYFFGRRMLSVQ